MEHHGEHTGGAPHRGARKRYGDGRQLTVRITKDMDDTLRDQARAEGLDMADVVRRALTRGLTPASSAEAPGDRAREAPLPA